MQKDSRNIFSVERLKPLTTKKNTIELKKESTPPTLSPKIRRKKNIGGNTELEGKISELVQIYEEEKQKNQELMAINFSNQEKYIKREKEFKKTLAEYEKVLFPDKKAKFPEIANRYREEIKETHREVNGKVESIQKQTILYLQEQEKLIVKELNNELNKFNKKIEENRKIDAKITVSESKEVLKSEIIQNRSKIEKIAEKNSSLQGKNKNIKTEFKSYENDLSILNTNISYLKQLNAKLKIELKSIKDKHAMSKTHEFFRINSKPAQTERIFTTKGENLLIENLKKMIELEKKNLRAAKNAYTRELQERNELESILRTAIDDFVVSPRGKISSRGNLSPKFKSRKETILLLYSKMFPMKKSSKKIEQEEIDSDYLIEHLDKNIENIERLYTQHEEYVQSKTERPHLGYS